MAQRDISLVGSWFSAGHEMEYILSYFPLLLLLRHWQSAWRCMEAGNRMSVEARATGDYTHVWSERLRKIYGYVTLIEDWVTASGRINWRMKPTHTIVSCLCWSANKSLAGPSPMPNFSVDFCFSSAYSSQNWSRRYECMFGNYSETHESTCEYQRSFMYLLKLNPYRFCGIFN